MFFSHIFAQVVSFIWKFFSPLCIPFFLSPPTLSTSLVKKIFTKCRWNVTSLGAISLISQTNFHPFRVPLPILTSPCHIYPGNSSLNVMSSAIFTLVYLTVNIPSSCSRSTLCLFSYYCNSLYLTICVNIRLFTHESAIFMKACVGSILLI